MDKFNFYFKYDNDLWITLMFLDFSKYVYSIEPCKYYLSSADNLLSILFIPFAILSFISMMFIMPIFIIVAIFCDIFITIPISILGSIKIERNN